MADGVEIYLEITKPKAPGRYGVIVEASGYHGTLYPRTGTRILPGPTKDGEPIGLKGYFPPRGYALVMMDVRGTGKSGGLPRPHRPQGHERHEGRDRVGDQPALVERARRDPRPLLRRRDLDRRGRHPREGPRHRRRQRGRRRLDVQPPVPGRACRTTPSSSGPSRPTRSSASSATFRPSCRRSATSRQPAAARRATTGPTPIPRRSAAGSPSRRSSRAWTSSPGASRLGTRSAPTQRPRRTTSPSFVIHGENDHAARVIGIDWFTARGGKAGDKLWLGQWDHGIGCCPNYRRQAWTSALHAWFDKQLLQRNVDTGARRSRSTSTTRRPLPEAYEARKEIFTSRRRGRRPPRPFSLYPADGGAMGEAKAGNGSASFFGDPQRATSARARPGRPATSPTRRRPPRRTGSSSACRSSSSRPR